jgi:hypothetical protein
LQNDELYCQRGAFEKVFLEIGSKQQKQAPLALLRLNFLIIAF